MLGLVPPAAPAREFIALACFIRLPGRPGVPAGARAGDVLQRDAVDRADGNAQLAAGALRLDYRVHALVGADDAIHRAGLDAQRAADAPGLVDPGHVARAFGTVFGVEGQGALAGERGQALHAFRATRRALVDGGFAGGDGVGVGRAVGVAAARALRLRQCVEQPRSQRAGRGGRVGHSDQKV